MTALWEGGIKSGCHEHFGKIDDAGSHATFRHDGTGQDEERDGKKWKIVHAVGRLQHYRLERQVGVDGGHDRREAKRVGDRHAEKADNGEATDKDEHIHCCKPALLTYSVVTVLISSGT